MRTLSLAILAGVLVYGLPTSASAQQNNNTPRLCPPGEILRDGVCGPRPRGGPGTNPGAGTGWVTGLPGYEPTICELVSGGGYHHCSESLGLHRPRK